MPLCALSEAECTRALARYRILQPCVEHDVPLTHMAQHHGLPLRTVQRWLARYRHAGLVQLVMIRYPNITRQARGLRPSPSPRISSTS
ncbi:MAG: helix-turn-helix domain-containing protein [Candidatus Entotheonellia bacterium]